MFNKGIKLASFIGIPVGIQNQLVEFGRRYVWDFAQYATPDPPTGARVAAGRPRVGSLGSQKVDTVQGKVATEAVTEPTTYGRLKLATLV